MGFTHVELSAHDHISFFNRIKLFDRQTGKHILPVHYSDNWITLMPDDRQKVTFSFSFAPPQECIQVVMDSWTAECIECE